MRRSLALFLTLAMILALLTACGGNNTTPPAASGDAGSSGGAAPAPAEPAAPEMLDIIRIGTSSWPASLDPGVAMGKTKTNILPQVFDTLLYCENDSTVSSYICDSWSMVDDLTAEFKLKDGVTFHNGAPLTAADVKYSFDRILKDDTGYVDPNIGAVVKTISEVQAVDDKTVRITTAAVDPILFDRLASYLSVYIVPQAYLEEVGTDVFATQPVGTGPYKVDSITPESLKLSYYEGYYGDAPAAKALEYRYIAEETALVTALITGEIDITTYLGTSSAKMLEGQNNITIFNQPASASHLLRFNTHASDKYLRQALSLAIDRQLLIDTLWDGYASVPNGYNYEEFGQYYVKDYPNVYTYDVEKAKELLKQSSYSGQTLSFQVVPGYYAMGTEAAEAIIDMWKQIGVNAKIDQVDAIKTGTIVDLANWSNGLRFSDPLGGMWALWGEGTGPQRDLWDAPARFNELGQLMQSETDVAARNALYSEMMSIWDDEVPGTILYCPDSIWAVRKGLTWNYQSGKAVNFRAGYLTVA